jgi:hypothetical protein
VGLVAVEIRKGSSPPNTSLQRSTTTLLSGIGLMIFRETNEQHKSTVLYVKNVEELMVKSSGTDD